MIACGISIEVLGTPAPKGSARAFYKAGMKRAVIVKDNSERQKSWDAAVRSAAREVLDRVFGKVDAPPFVGVPVAVEIAFLMMRPASHYGTGKRAGQLKPNAPSCPSTKPDIDKLARTTLDALTGIMFDDDGRIARLELVKAYARPGEEGARITVRELNTERGTRDGAKLLALGDRAQTGADA